MPKLSKIAQKLFASTASAGEIGKFGSLAAGLPETTIDPNEVQELANFNAGWVSAILGNNSPAIEDMNGLFFLAFRQLAYIMERGVPEWDAETNYFIDSIINVDGDLYVSLTDDNLNNAVTDGSHWKEIIQEGQLLTVSPNRIISGKTRSTSNQPQFIKPNGAAASFILEGFATNLSLYINNVKSLVDTDIIKAGLTVGPSVTPTCLINNIDAADQKSTRVWGEHGASRGTIDVDTMGAEFQAFIGQWQVIKIAGVTTEYALAYIKSATELTKIYRGYFTDSTDAPVNRSAFSDNDVITVLSTGWIFIESDGLTVDVSYTTPIESHSEPSAPTTGDYWKDLSNKKWKRYDGAAWQVVNRSLIGVTGIDSVNCVCARSFDFHGEYSNNNNVEIEISSVSTIKMKSQNSEINIYGNNFNLGFNNQGWDMANDLAIAADMYSATEQSSTDYYLYLKDTGEAVISDISPHYRHDLLGKYHPHNPWRCVGLCFNDGSNNLVVVSEVGFNSEIVRAYSEARDEKPSGTNGGTSVATTWNTRVLNTHNSHSTFSLIDSNQKLLLAGKYILNGKSMLYRANGVRSRFYNATDLKVEKQGINGYSISVSASGIDTPDINAEIIIDVSSYIEIQYRQDGGPITTNGLGVSSSSGQNEVYAEIYSQRIGKE